MAGNATITSGSLEISPAQVTYNSVDLGATLDNITVNWEYTKAEMKADQLGTTVIDRSISGFNATVETAIAEVRDKDKIMKVMPTLRDTTVSSVRVLDFMNRITFRDSGNAAQLRLHRLSDNNSDENLDVVFWKAMPSEASSIVFGAEEQMKMNIVWNILPDFTEGQDRVRFMRIGDKDTVVP